MESFDRSRLIANRLIDFKVDSQAKVISVELEVDDLFSLKKFISTDVLRFEFEKIDAEAFLFKAKLVFVYRVNEATRSFLDFIDWYFSECKVNKDFENFLKAEIRDERQNLSEISKFILFGEYGSFYYDNSMFSSFFERGLLSEAVIFDFLNNTRVYSKRFSKECWKCVDDFTKDMAKDVVRVWIRRFTKGKTGSYFISVLRSVKTMDMNDVYGICREAVENDKKLFDYLRRFLRKGLRQKTKVEDVEAILKIAPERLLGAVSKYMLLG